MAKGLYIEGRAIKGFADIVRNYNHEISFSNSQGFLGEYWGDEDFTLRARKFSLPQRGNETIESNFGGMKQFFPGKPTFGNTLNIVFEETESQKVQRFLGEWQQKMFNINAGHAEYYSKRGTNDMQGICETITITTYGVNGEPLENKYYFKNAWIQNVDEVSIDYSTSEAIQYSCTFQFDFWTYGKTDPAEYGEGKGWDVGNNSTGAGGDEAIAGN